MISNTSWHGLRFDKIGGYEEFPFHFAVDIWDHIAKNTDFNIGLQENVRTLAIFMYLIFLLFVV